MHSAYTLANPVDLNNLWKHRTPAIGPLQQHHFSRRQTATLKSSGQEGITERISMRGTNLEILSSFDLIITTSIMQSDNESISVM